MILVMFLEDEDFGGGGGETEFSVILTFPFNADPISAHCSNKTFENSIKGQN